jgi:dGTPase
MINERHIREMTEEREESLSPHAVKSKWSRGRLRPEEPCPIRTVFQRDRDRIIHAKAFRRLKHKTQVFIAPQGDHYVTRLTHTLEVAQIARTIARALNLNEDLTEAIGLGHDLGHTPFGHVGEDVLNELYPEGFRHNEQSLRVVDLLENDGQGLNLTWEVRDGILNHSKSRTGTLENWGVVNTLEGEVCRMADIVAYVNHDIGDAIRAGIITEDDLPSSSVAVLGHSHRERINAMVCDIIERSWAVRSAGKIATPTIAMSPPVLESTSILRDFLFERVYNLLSAQKAVDRAREIVRRLYHYFNKHADKLPPEYALYSDELARRVVDYIAGMTDQYATRMARGLAPSKGKTKVR